MDELLKKFSVEAMTEIITQRKVEPHFITDTFFKRWTPTLSVTHNLIVKKGGSVVLSSVSENGEHLVNDADDETIISVPLPRFPQSDVLPASEMNLLKTLNTQNEQIKSLSAAIGDRLARQKSNVANTLEYMAIGAIFGRVMDGAGTELFSLTNTSSSITIAAATTLLSLVEQIEAKQVEALGAPKPYIALITRALYEDLLAKAEAADMFKHGTAKITDKGGVLALEVFGKAFMPYDAKFKNAKGKAVSYMSGKQGVVVPLDESVFEIVYTRANHTAAVGKAPTKFFAAAPETLPKGAGWSIVSEARMIPICNRLDAIIALQG